MFNMFKNSKVILSVMLCLFLMVTLLPEGVTAAGGSLTVNGIQLSYEQTKDGEVIVTPVKDEWDRIDQNVNPGGLIVFSASGLPDNARRLVLRSDARWYDNSDIRTRYDIDGYGSVTATNGIFKNAALKDGKVDVIIDLFTLEISGRQDGKAVAAAKDEVYTPFVASNTQSYTVHSGDSLSKIAMRFGMSWQQLAKQNPQIKNPDRIYRGQVLDVGIKPSDYSIDANWMSLPKSPDKPVDVFYVYPTVYTAEGNEPLFAEMDSPAMHEAAKPVLDEHSAVYADTGNIYAPYYRQLSTNLLFTHTNMISRMVTGTPANDVIAAFDYYLDNYNNGRPFILAGHSQGTEVLMCLLPHIAEEHPEAYKRMVAGYLIGSSVTENYLKDNPEIKFAEGASDTGVIISYNTEMPDMTAEVPIVKPGARSINPLNWKTDDTYAPAELNLGDLKFDAQINLSRGTVTCSTADPNEWSIPLPIFPRGCYHGGDYKFYYENLKQNTLDRVKAYLGSAESEAAEPTKENSAAAWETIEDAYAFTLPLVLMDATAKHFTNTVEATGNKAPVNQFIHSKKLANALSKAVVTPNVDTIYSQAHFDLSKDAYVLKKPATDRFCSFEIMDAYTNSVAILGTGGDTQEERVYLLAGPGFDGDIPKGMTRVALPTNMAWMIGRTIVENERDLQNVYEIQDGMALVPLSAYLKNGFDYTPPKGETNPAYEYIPVSHVLEMTPMEYFSRANELMAQNLPAAADKPVTERLAQINVGPGLVFDASVLGESHEQKWADMIDGLQEELDKKSTQFTRKMGAWSFYGEPIAEFGTQYEYRALIALAALGANPVSVAIYPKAGVDDTGQTLNGKNSCRLHFDKDALPPVMEHGFWSVTAYGEDNFLIDNELDRYAITDRSEVKFNSDGSLDILLQTEPPEDTAMLGNWLPVKAEQFHLFMRIYLPKESVFDGTWKAPAIIAGP